MSDDEIRATVREWLQCQHCKSYQLAGEIGIRPQTFYAQMSVRKISDNTKRALARIIPALMSEPDLRLSSFRIETTPNASKSRSGSKLMVKRGSGWRNNAGFPFGPCILGFQPAEEFQPRSPCLLRS